MIIKIILIVAGKIGRKWQNIDIEFPISRGSGRSSVRMSSTAMNTNHHPGPSTSSTSYNSAAPTAVARGGMASNRRSGISSNGSLIRGRGGRSVNGCNQLRSSLRVPDSETTQDALNAAPDTNNTESASRTVTQATPGFASGPPRGTFSRGRRSGSRGGSGYGNTNYMTRNTVSNIHQPTSVTMTVSHQASVASTVAAVSAQTMNPMSAVGQGLSLFVRLVLIYCYHGVNIFSSFSHIYVP